MINQVTLIGNLGEEPELRKLESGNMVGKFSLATNDSYKDKNGEWQNQVEWHKIIVWNQLAERAEKYLKKGTKVFITGKITYRSWETKEGEMRWVAEIVANKLRLLDKKDVDDSQHKRKEVIQTTSAVSSEMPEIEDDLPF